MSAKVNIIMSTYNGERYIREQLDSLLKQDYPDIEIYVRDDGSTDQTFAILQDYAQKYGIHVVQGKNLGFAGSFFEAMRMAEEGDYYSFCDQDDIWLPDKVRLAVKCLEQQKQDRPLLYYSFSEMFDDAGIDLGVQKPPKGSLCFARSLTGTFGVGFSMVVNKRLRDEMLKCDPNKVHAHDWLAGAIALGFGKVFVNQKICARYRRLDTSVTRISFGRRVKWAISMLQGDGDVKERNQEFFKVYKEKLSPEKYALAELFGTPGYSLKRSLKKAFYPKRWRPSVSSECVMRFLMLTGRV